jgi:large subunit ribosomal protein L4
MELSVYNIAGQDTGRKVQLSDEIFGIQPNDHAIYLDVRQFMDNNRQGTHKAKERAEVAYSTRKLKKQKGSGSARYGSQKSPLFRGGGRIFGPRPRNYYFKLNKKVKALARKSALSYKAVNQDIIILEDFNFQTPRTKEFINILGNLKIDEKRMLMVLSESNKSIYLSSRNLTRSKVVTVSEINTYEILKASTLVLLESTVDVLEKTFNN